MEDQNNCDNFRENNPGIVSLLDQGNQVIGKLSDDDSLSPLKKCAVKNNAVDIWSGAGIKIDSLMHF